MSWPLGRGPLCATRCGRMAVGELDGEPLCAECCDVRISDDGYTMAEELAAEERQARERAAWQRESRSRQALADWIEENPEEARRLGLLSTDDSGAGSPVGA